MIGIKFIAKGALYPINELGNDETQKYLRSTVDYLKNNGYPCFESDKVAKKLLEGELKDSIIKLFGKEIYNPKGILNSRVLSKKVFSDSKLLKNLNDTEHPAVHKAFVKARTEIGAWTNLSDSPYISQRNRALGL